MLFAPIYIAMTIIRSWRIRSFRAKLLEFLSGDTSVAFCKVPENAAETPTLSSKLCTNPKTAYLCDIFFYTNVSRVCSMKPAQCIDLTDWVACSGGMPLGNQEIYEREWEVNVLLECEMEQHSFRVNQNNISVESIGQPVAWKAGSHLAIVLRSTIELLSVSGFQFVAGEFVVTKQLPVVRIQTVQLSGEPNKATDPSMRSLRSEIQHNLQLPNTEFQWANHASLLRKLSKVVDVKTEPRNTFNGTLNGNTDHETNVQRRSVTLADVSVNTGKSLNEDSPTETELLKDIEKSPEIHKSPNKNASNLDIQNYNHIENVTVEIEHNITPNKSSLRLDLKKGGRISASLLNMSSQIKSVTTHKRVFSSTAPKEPEAEASCSNGGVPKSLRSSRPLVNTKSPNVLIYSDSKAASENLEASIRKVLDCDRYTVYSINASSLEAGAWRGRCSLIAMAGSVGKAAPLLLSHLLEGGRLLALCSDLLHTVLPHYKTAEVRENEIVQVSYDRWKSVKMKHHIFCYQASPAKKQFSTENDTQVSKYVDHRGQELEISVLASEQTWHTASLLQATHPTTQGRAIFSQIHLEASPADYLSDPSEIAATESARLEILHKIVGDVLGLYVKDPQLETPVQYTRGYFLGNHVDKLSFVNTVCKEIKDGRRLQKLGNTTLQYCMRDEIPMDEPSDKFLPVYIYECPDNFSTVEYFDNLTSSTIGRLLIYSDILTSTQELAMGGPLGEGVALVAGRMTQGKGRGNNRWLSHKGQACITVQLHMKLSSTISLVQHCAALAAVLAVRTMPGYELLDIRIKWPNDIYYGRDTKIGGNLTTATCVGDTAIVNTGTGINISNALPTTCINNIITEYNRRNHTNLAPISVETYLATYCSRLEETLRLIDAPETLLEQYRRFWLHANEQIKLIRGTDSTPTTGTIIGLDNAGWLLVRTESGEKTTVAPDGNTFDIMTGLIAPKY